MGPSPMPPNQEVYVWKFRPQTSKKKVESIRFKPFTESFRGKNPQKDYGDAKVCGSPSHIDVSES